MTGLVLEGGALRGLFTAGVLDWMMAAGLTAAARTTVVEEMASGWV